VGVCAPDDDRVRHVREVDVSNELGVAAEQALVLDPWQ
jgi:hypothetical protein